MCNAYFQTKLLAPDPALTRYDPWSENTTVTVVSTATGSPFKRRAPERDHWRRTEKDPGRPYEFKDAEKLVDDFFNEVERVLTERGIATVVVDVEETRRSK